MDLAKHSDGKPLSSAELEQRRNAARARWASVAAGGTVGALVGGAVGAARAGILTQNRAALQVRNLALQGTGDILAAEEGVQRRANVRGQQIHDAIAWRKRPAPETAKERNARTLELIQQARRPNPKDLRPARPPVIGTPTNQPAPLVYDYELEIHRRKLGAEQRHLDRMLAREAAGEDIPGRELRAQRIRVDRWKRDIEHLEQLKANAPKTIGRAGHTSAKGSNVSAAVERKFRRGETTPQVKRRISAAKKALTERSDRMLEPGGLLDRRTQKLRTIAREGVLDHTEAAIRQAFREGRYGRQLLHGAGRGAAIGATIGLTAAGLGALAHYIATAQPRKPKALAKAAPDESPEASMATGMAEAYRKWIDRLLGKTDDPLNFGDDIAHALAPGITDAFAQGATQQPVEPNPDGYYVDVNFDVLNPAVRRHMADYTLDRIVDITHAQREAIRTVLMDKSVLQGIGPIEVARTIRQAIGLTPYQQGVVRGFREELETLNPSALGRKLRDRRYDRTVERAIREGASLSRDQIDAMVDAYQRRMLALRAETIARTEAIRSTSYGAMARAQEVLDLHPELDCIKRWIATDDPRTRDTHRDLNGKEVQGLMTPFITSAGNQLRWPVDQDGVADEVINCLLPGTRVYADEVLAASRREFDGEVVTIELADGTQLSTTGNHPILTPGGLTATQDLQEGDRVIRCRRRDWASEIDNDQERHPRIEDIEHALNVAGGSHTSKVGMAMDFHAEGVGGQIDVAIADYDLTGAGDPMLGQHVGKRYLGGADLVAAFMPDHRLSCSKNVPLLSSPNAVMGCGDLRLTLALAHLSPFGELSLASPPNRSSAFQQEVVDRTSAHAKALRECVDRGAGVIELQQVARITRKRWSGHVYNLETRSGLYLAEGIGNHNCRCAIGFRFVPKRGQLMAVAA